MKHIKKRFLLEYPTGKYDLNQIAIKIESGKDFINGDLINNKNTLVLMDTEEDITIGGFVYKLNGKKYILPVPDPTLIYFNNAQEQLRQIIIYKKNLLKKLDVQNESLSETALNDIYLFYGATSGFVVFLFTSVESFINQMIPKEYVYKKEKNNKTEMYNHNQIMNGIDFKVKIKGILPEILGKSYFKKSTPSNEMIWNLKEFRDEIIHTKPQDNNPLKYKKIIKKSLDFRYDDTLEAVAKFMNFYRKGYIVECDCGVDF